MLYTDQQFAQREGKQMKTLQLSTKMRRWSDLPAEFDFGLSMRDDVSNVQSHDAELSWDHLPDTAGDNSARCGTNTKGNCAPGLVYTAAIPECPNVLQLGQLAASSETQHTPSKSVQ